MIFDHYMLFYYTYLVAFPEIELIGVQILFYIQHLLNIVYVIVDDEYQLVFNECI
jgi:hypothetical protein